MYLDVCQFVSPIKFSWSYSKLSEQEKSHINKVLIDPNSKKGYFNRLAIITAQIKPNPKREPALVLWTKCDTPIAVLAKRIPGPNVLSMFFLLIMNLYLVEL